MSFNIRISLICVLFFFLSAIESFPEDIRDIQPPVNMPPNYFPLYLILIILAAYPFYLLIKFLKNHFKKLNTEPPMVKSPWEIAYERLDELKKQNLHSNGMLKDYYTILSDLIRRYIEDRFKISAPEMTTEEFLQFLKNSRDLSLENKQLLDNFLNSCDMVKFARHNPTINETENSYNSARIFIDKTKENL